jgi:hypothetical protein
VATVLPARVLDGVSPAEIKVRDALKQLPSPWTVLHGIAWQDVRNGRPGDGEADFVLLHPGHGMLVVEVKGGGIGIDSGAWYSTDRFGERHAIKNPFEQATSSKNALVRFLRSQNAVRGFLPCGPAVAFPDLAWLDGLGPAASPQVVWSSSSLQSMRSVVEDTVSHWEMAADLSGSEIEAITRLLVPTLAVRPLLRESVADITQQQLDLTIEQTKVLDNLRRTRRAVIYGGAGTGKSLLAAERARRLANQGCSVLLTCFNRPLGDQLELAFADDERVRVSSFHALCRTELQAAGMAVPARPTQRWWDEDLPASLPDAADQTGLRFDAIVVDEGQDFAPAWWTSLQLLLNHPDDDPFYVFADTQQGLYRRAWEPPFSGVEYELTVNCRNTIEIGRVVAGVFGDEPLTLGVSGPPPVQQVVPDFAAVGEALRRTMHRLLRVERLQPGQVVVLSASKALVLHLRERPLGPHRFVGAGSTDGIVAETIHRYKGLEADAVVVIVHEVGPDTPVLLYVGLSRARAHLEIIATEAVADLL